jgi:dTDP-4-dehydrorhamnose reductase
MILLLGGSGLLGKSFKVVFSREKIVFEAPSSSEFNLQSDEKLFQQFFAGKNYSLIINCAGYTNVDKAEQEQDLCQNLNVNAVQKLSQQKIPLMTFSSDYVFNQKNEIPIAENCLRQAINFYGASKIAMEKELEKSKIEWWNIRTSWLFGFGGKNFIDTILRLSSEKKSLQIVGDQFGRPTFTDDLAEFIVENFIKKRQPKGHYHLQNQGEIISWYGLAKFFLAEKKWEGDLQKISQENYKTPAERPINSVLENTKLSENLPDWKIAVRKFLAKR